MYDTIMHNSCAFRETYIYNIKPKRSYENQKYTWTNLLNYNSCSRSIEIKTIKQVIFIYHKNAYEKLQY